MFYWNLLSYMSSALLISGRQQVSILVLLEPPLILLTLTGRLANGEFQSLFYWNLLSYETENTHFLISKKVSILVLLEPPLILARIVSLTKQFGNVSILVLLEPPLIHRNDRTDLLQSDVSILVLLEPPLIQSFYVINNIFYVSFNPCFTGTSSHTSLPCDFFQAFGMFQSLFYWNLLSYTE